MTRRSRGKIRRTDLPADSKLILFRDRLCDPKRPHPIVSYHFSTRGYSLRRRSESICVTCAVDAHNFEKSELARTWFVAQAMRQCPVALVVSADRQVRQLIVASLDELGCTTLDAASDKQGLEFAAVTRVDCVIVDACPPETLVSHMIRQLRLLQPEIRVLYLVDRTSAVPSPWSALRPTDTCLNKPFQLGELCKIVESWWGDSLAFVNVAGISLN